MRVFTVIITGASGSVYGMRLVEVLLTAGHGVSLIATKAGNEVMEYELGVSAAGPESAGALADFLEVSDTSRLRIVRADDLFDPIASGSRKVDATIVMPASMGFCGSLSSGLASNLPERAADVALKERRTLVLVPRETPLNLIHLRNLTALAEAGAIIAPAMPAFYQRPQTIEDQVDFVVGKVLDLIGVEHSLFARWGD